jgi:flagellar basal-body rod protein FlgC
MGIEKVSTPIDVAVSGLRAESLRMKVIANNIANSNTEKTDGGTPYRRQQVLASTQAGALTGVTETRVADDTSSPFKSVYDPGNPDASPDGFVEMPNINLPVEMMDMVVANRAYQANAAVLKRYQESVDVALELLR